MPTIFKGYDLSFKLPRHKNAYDEFMPGLDANANESISGFLITSHGLKQYAIGFFYRGRLYLGVSVGLHSECFGFECIINNRSLGVYALK